MSSFQKGYANRKEYSLFVFKMFIYKAGSRDGLNQSIAEWVGPLGSSLTLSVILSTDQANPMLIGHRLLGFE